MWSRAVFWVPVVALVAGCATQADVQRLRRDLYRASRGVVEVRTSLSSVRRDVEILAGRVERIRHLRGRQPGVAGGDTGVSYERVMQLEDRVAKLELLFESGSPRTEGGRSVEGLPPTGETPRPAAINLCGAYAADPDAPSEMRSAGKSMNEGTYELAISQYRGFLRQQASSPLADDAQFCIGESYFQLGDYSTAIYEFDNVRVKYPSSDKIPIALLRSGYGFVKLGNTRDAKLFFQKLVRDYASSQEAIKARQELDLLAGD